MPIEKRKGESKEDYIGRCIGIEVADGKDPSQAAAICYAKWENMADETLSAITEIRKFKVTYGNTRTRNNAIKSANVWKYKYDDVKQLLVVKFQDGTTYTYEGVPESVFEEFKTGDGGTCDTEGSNEWGSWKIGKNPSMGAAIWDVLQNAGYKGSKGGSV